MLGNKNSSKGGITMSVYNEATYGTLVEKLLDNCSGKVVTLPDGSIDIYHKVLVGRGNTANSRHEFAEWITDEATSSCRLHEVDRTAGGQTVNTAIQSKNLGDEVVVFGHLDDPIFDNLGMQTRSIGEPAEVNILILGNRELILSKAPSGFSNWNPESLYSFPDYPMQLREADVICVQNWMSFDNMNDLLNGISNEDLGGARIIFDPGDITGSSEAEISRLTRDIQRLADEKEVVLSLNRREMEYLIGVPGIQFSELNQHLEQLRSELGLEATVIHHREWALGSTSTDSICVPNLEANSEKRATGAGDRFNGGMAHALASGWSWEVALLLGNACASYHVETGETATVESIISFLSDRSYPDPSDEKSF